MIFMKQKIMLDNNAFDSLIKEINLLLKTLDKYEYYLIDITYDELIAIPDTKKEKRLNLLEMMNKLNINFAYTTPAVYGKAKYGRSKYDGDTKAFESILKCTRSNINDALIGSSAIAENCILVTNDTEFQAKMRNNAYDVLSTDEFIEYIRKYE